MKPEHLAPPEDSIMQWDHQVCLQGSKKLMQSLMVVTGSTKTSENKNQQSGGGGGWEGRRLLPCAHSLCLALSQFPLQHHSRLSFLLHHHTMCATIHLPVRSTVWTWLHFLFLSQCLGLFLSYCLKKKATKRNRGKIHLAEVFKVSACCLVSFTHLCQL